MERVQIFGIILLLLGLAMRHWVNRRRFNRRTITGTQVFGSYEKAVALTFLERIIRLLGLAVLVFGLLLIATGLF